MSQRAEPTGIKHVRAPMWALESKAKGALWLAVWQAGQFLSDNEIRQCVEETLEKGRDDG